MNKDYFTSTANNLQNYYGGQLQVPSQAYDDTTCYDILCEAFDEPVIDLFLNENSGSWYGFGRIDENWFALAGEAEITSDGTLYVVEVEKEDVPEHIQELFAY